MFVERKENLFSSTFYEGENSVSRSGSTKPNHSNAVPCSLDRTILVTGFQCKVRTEPHLEKSVRSISLGDIHS